MTEPLEPMDLDNIYMCCGCSQEVRLVNELKATRAERDRAIAAHVFDSAFCRERAERAERAEAAIARVEAIEAGNICPHGYEAGETGCGCYMCRVRAALRGNND